MARKQPKTVELRDLQEVSTDPLPAYQVLLSLAAQCNITGRWISSQMDELLDYGGLEAAADCFASADILLALIEQWREKLVDTMVEMPEGIGWQKKTGISIEGKNPSDTQH